MLVGELLRATGRQRLGDARLDLFLAEQMWNETKVEIPRRIGAFARARDLAPAVACALLLNADIWTNDNDFLGTGVPTWTTATLQRWLDRQPPAEHDG